MQESQLQESQIKIYLENNPYFFEQHPALLADLFLPSPHGNGTISLAERQQLAQRDKINALESKFAELVKIGNENEVISNKVHALTLGLLASQQLVISLQLLQHYLQMELNVPHGVLKVWTNAKNVNDAVNPIFALETMQNLALLDWIQSLETPYCGTAPEPTIKSWLNEDVQSYAVIALHSNKIFGALILASDDARHFYPEMGTMFLKRIGELVSASLLRYVD
ncbi:MAG: DUF484 family protein [Methylophilaceae bacterium]|nr:DUF484 family protein [Methylophilaceae bacterium]